MTDDEDKCSECGHIFYEHTRETNKGGADVSIMTGCNVEECECVWFIE